jgi:hypothetical protein
VTAQDIDCYAQCYTPIHREGLGKLGSWPWARTRPVETWASYTTMSPGDGGGLCRTTSVAQQSLGRAHTDTSRKRRGEEKILVGYPSWAV